MPRTLCKYHLEMKKHITNTSICSWHFPKKLSSWYVLIDSPFLLDFRDKPNHRSTQIRQKSEMFLDFGGYPTTVTRLISHPKSEKIQPHLIARTGKASSKSHSTSPWSNSLTEFTMEIIGKASNEMDRFSHDDVKNYQSLNRLTSINHY